MSVEGFEPSCLSTKDFKSFVYTCSTTQTHCVELEKPRNSSSTWQDYRESFQCHRNERNITEWRKNSYAKRMSRTRTYDHGTPSSRDFIQLNYHPYRFDQKIWGFCNLRWSSFLGDSATQKDVLESNQQQLNGFHLVCFHQLSCTLLSFIQTEERGFEPPKHSASHPVCDCFGHLHTLPS